MFCDMIVPSNSGDGFNVASPEICVRPKENPSGNAIKISGFSEETFIFARSGK